MNAFTRSTHNSSWYGYRATLTNPIPVHLSPDSETENKRVRVDVWVREFVSVQIKEIKESDREGRGGTRSASVTFDSGSVVTGSDKKLEHDFSASTQVGSALHEALVKAHASGLAVYVGLETKRRYKDKRGEVVPYTTPMHVLRGANPDGSRANSNITGNNCSNVIAVAGPADSPETNIIAAEASTDPTEWDQFRHNRDGSMAPEGWRHVYLDDGTRAGAIVQADTPDNAGGNIDATTLAREVAALLAGEGDASRGEQAVRQARSVEGKPWQVRNSDGRINPAGPLPQMVRWARHDATELIKDAVYNEDAEIDGATFNKAATTLVKPLIWAASQAQKYAVGYVRKTEPSFREASKWVYQVASTENPFQVGYIDDTNAAKKWTSAVAEAAGELYALALQLADDYATEECGPGVADVDTSAQGARQAQQARTEAGSEQAPAPAEPAAPSPEPNSAPEQHQETLADRPDLQSKWDELIEKIGFAKYPERLNPILHKKFSTHMSSQIPAARFERMVTAGLEQPEAFFEAAKQAALTAAA